MIESAGVRRTRPHTLNYTQKRTGQAMASGHTGAVLVGTLYSLPALSAFAWSRFCSSESTAKAIQAVDMVIAPEHGA